VRYVQWIQDISKEHWQTVAPNVMKAGILWVVKNHNIDYVSSAVLADEILIRTFIAETKGAISVRCVEMYNDKTNQLLVRSHTEWCLLNALTLKPIRISDAIKKVFVSK
jgi:acyl-CoA thioester hydrolase